MGGARDGFRKDARRFILTGIMWEPNRAPPKRARQRRGRAKALSLRRFD
jgi:hypothetical protein